MGQLLACSHCSCLLTLRGCAGYFYVHRTSCQRLCQTRRLEWLHTALLGPVTQLWLFQSPSPPGLQRFPNTPGLYSKCNLCSCCCWGGTSLFSTGSENRSLKGLVSVWPVPCGSVLHCTEAFTVCVTVSHWQNKKALHL